MPPITGSSAPAGEWQGSPRALEHAQVGTVNTGGDESR